MLKKLLLSASTALFLLTTFSNVSAIGYPSYNNPHSRYQSQYSSDNNPSYHIMEAVSKIKKFSASSTNVPPALLKSFLDREIIPLFDFESMANWITGPYVKYMTGPDQAEFHANLKETFLSSLDTHLGSYNTETTKIRYYPARYKRNGEADVGVLVSRTGQFPARLNFRMKKKGSQWKIIDVKANGTSAVLFYRRHFMSQLRQYGS